MRYLWPFPWAVLNVSDSVSLAYFLLRFCLCDSVLGDWKVYACKLTIESVRSMHYERKNQCQYWSFCSRVHLHCWRRKSKKLTHIHHLAWKSSSCVWSLVITYSKSCERRVHAKYGHCVDKLCACSLLSFDFDLSSILHVHVLLPSQDSLPFLFVTLTHKSMAPS